MAGPEEESSLWLPLHVPLTPPAEGASVGFQVSRPVMEKVPYALKIETSESCLTLSARYGEEEGGKAWWAGRGGEGGKEQSFTGGKV